MNANEKIKNLERSLAREKAARKSAENMLEQKSKELFDFSEALKQSNQQLQQLLTEKTSELEGVFSNIIDAYVVMDISGNVLRMNEPANELLGFSISENINLLDLVHPDYKEYTELAFKQLFKTGTFSHYKAVIITKAKEEKIVEINASIIYDLHGKPKAAQGIVRDITQETERKIELKEQKIELDIIVDNSPIGIALITPGTKGFVKVNAAFCNMLEYSMDELLNIDVSAITHPDDTQESIEYLKKLASGDFDTFKIEKKYLTKTGKTIWARTSVSAVRENSGKIKFQVAVIEDISNEISSKQKIKESEERLSNLVANLQTGVLLEDEFRNVVLANEMCCSMFEMGVSPEELIGSNLNGSNEAYMDYFKKPQQFLSRLEEVLAKKTRVIGEELELKDGRVLERNYTPIFVDDIYRGHLWSFNDITLQKNYKDGLRAQKEKYSSIIANMNLGLLEVSNECIILLANQSFSDLSGYSERELLGKSADKLFNYREKGCHGSNNFLNLGVALSEPFEIKIRDKSGKKKFWLVSGAPNFDAQGNQSGFILIHLDITNQKLLEIQKEKLLISLEKQNEQLNEYAHIVSHDLKSPLRNISALLSWTKEDFKEKLSEESFTNLDLMQNKLEQMDHLIENILEYSSIDSDVIRNEKVDLNQLLEEVLAILYIPEHIKVIIKQPLPIINADATRIQQAFQNLIGNAVNYIDKEKGLVEIDYSENKTHYVFSVKDNGMGIAPENHEKIFTIFRSLGDNEKSSGIGLSIVKKVVELYKGKIWLESKMNSGTIFYFSLHK